MATSAIEPHVVEAAAAVFARKGYRGTSMRDLANALGMQRGSLYHYIESKEHLLYAVVLQPVRNNVAELEAIVHGEGSVPERLAAFIRAHIASLHECYPQLFVLLQERFPVGDDLAEGREIAELVRRYDQLVTDLIAEGIRDGSLRPDIDPRLGARAVLGMCNWIHKWYRPGKESPSEVAAAFCAVALGGLTATSESR